MTMIHTRRWGLWKRTLALLLSALAVVALAGLAAACNDDDDNGNGDGEAQAVEQTLRDAAQAWNDGDLDSFLGYFTDAGLESLFDVSREDAEQALGDFIGTLEIEVVSISNTEVDGDTASLEAEMREGAGVNSYRYTFVREDGDWLIDSEEPLEAEIPEGVTVVEVEMDEMEFRFDEGEIGDGNVAFRAINVGDQPHELVLAGIPADRDLDDLISDLLELEEGPPPDYVEFVGVAFADPGESANLVLAEPLGAGRYLMICFLPDTDDEDGTSHAALGMYDEFTVE
jgi:hypothetical protein